MEYLLCGNLITGVDLVYDREPRSWGSGEEGRFSRLYPMGKLSVLSTCCPLVRDSPGALPPALYTVPGCAHLQLL